MKSKVLSGELMGQVSFFLSYRPLQYVIRICHIIANSYSCKGLVPFAMKVMRTDMTTTDSKGLVPYAMRTDTTTTDSNGLVPYTMNDMTTDSEGLAIIRITTFILQLVQTTVIG